MAILKSMQTRVGIIVLINSFETIRLKSQLVHSDDDTKYMNVYVIQHYKGRDNYVN